MPTALRTGLSTLLAAVFLPLAATSLAAAEYKIDLSHSFIKFRTGHLGFSWLHGRFNKFEGTFQYDADAGPEAQSVSLTIDTTSVDTNWAERDKHLRSPDFFNVDKFPTATFKSTGFKGDGNGGTLSGDLTLMGVTKPISFKVKKIGEGDDPWGGYRAGFEGSYVLNRSDFGMTKNLGPSAEKIEIELFLEGLKAK